MYADVCTKGLGCACVLFMQVWVTYVCVCVCIIIHFSGMSGVFVHVRTPPLLLLSAATFLGGALVRLELHELFRHVVVVALREDPQHRQARLVHVDAPAQRHPAGDAALAGYVLHLQHGHAHGAVLPGKAVVLHTHLQLVALGTHLGAQRAEKKRNSQHFILSRVGTQRDRAGHSLLEAFVEFRRPAVVLGFGGKLPLFVTEVRADDEDFHEGPETLRLPF